MWSKYLHGYLYRIRKVLLWAALAAACFLLVFYLTDVPASAFGYAALLAAVCGLAFFAAGFARFVKNRSALADLNAQEEPIAEEFPEPMDALEKDYQDLAGKLYRNAQRLEQNGQCARRDMLDYYTLWVHQIKTPIFAMRLLLQAQEGENSAAMEMELFKIEQYTDMVLQYLRLESDSNDFVLQTYDLDDMIRQALRKYAKLFIGRKLSLDFRETHRRVVTDEKWFVFVIEQLLSNALKYTDKGKVSVYLKDESLVIEDTGIGISQEDLPRIFEKGYTGFNGRMDKKATGLGLYLCRRVCERLSCRISAQSAPGAGTRFYLTVPPAAGSHPAVT